MALASSSVLTVEQAQSDVCCLHLCPQDESQLPPASPGGSPRSANGSDPGSFQITASVLDLRVCWILHVHFKNEISSYCPLGLCIKAYCPSKPDVLGAHLPNSGPPGYKVQCGACIPFSLGKTFAIVIIFLFMSCLPRGESLSCTASPLSSYLSHCGAFFIFSVVENFFC